MSTKSELKREIAALKLDVYTAQGRLAVACHELQMLEITERAAKQARCKHKFELRSEREFDRHGFIDIEYQYCPKCKAVHNPKTVNTVNNSERY
jgi:hypothetical protein